MLRKSLPLILAMFFVFAGSAAAATNLDEICYNVRLNASPDIFKDGQTINFKIQYQCKAEVNDAEIEIWYGSDQVAAKYGVTLGKGSHSVDVKGNGFKGRQGTYTAVFKKKGAISKRHSESTVCKSWSIGR